MKALTQSMALLSGLSVAALIGAHESSQAEDKQIYRVVTTIDQVGKSTAMFDSVVPLKLGGGWRKRGHDMDN